MTIEEIGKNANYFNELSVVSVLIKILYFSAIANYTKDNAFTF